MGSAYASRYIRSVQRRKLINTKIIRIYYAEFNILINPNKEKGRGLKSSQKTVTVRGASE